MINNGPLLLVDSNSNNYNKTKQFLNGEDPRNYYLMCDTRARARASASICSSTNHLKHHLQNQQPQHQIDQKISTRGREH